MQTETINGNTIAVPLDVVKKMEPQLLEELEAINARRHVIEGILAAIRPPLASAPKEVKYYAVHNRIITKKGIKPINKGLQNDVLQILKNSTHTNMTSAQISKKYLISTGRRPTKNAIAKTVSSVTSILKHFIDKGVLKRQKGLRGGFAYWWAGEQLPAEIQQPGGLFEHEKIATV
jgi:hypothetical protein